MGGGRGEGGGEIVHGFFYERAKCYFPFGEMRFFKNFSSLSLPLPAPLLSKTRKRDYEKIKIIVEGTFSGILYVFFPFFSFFSFFFFFF